MTHESLISGHVSLLMLFCLSYGDLLPILTIPATVSFAWASLSQHLYWSSRRASEDTCFTDDLADDLGPWSQHISALSTPLLLTIAFRLVVGLMIISLKHYNAQKPTCLCLGLSNISTILMVATKWIFVCELDYIIHECVFIIGVVVVVLFTLDSKTESMKQKVAYRRRSKDYDKSSNTVSEDEDNAPITVNAGWKYQETCDNVDVFSLSTAMSSFIYMLFKIFIAVTFTPMYSDSNTVSTVSAVLVNDCTNPVVVLGLMLGFGKVCNGFVYALATLYENVLTQMVS